MPTNYSPSVNIIRDEHKVLNYLLTPNAQNAAIQILNDFKKGIHTFSIVGSYGTGKSSFLWAFQNTLTSKNKFFDIKLPKGLKNTHVVSFIGDYQSLITVFNEEFGIKEDYKSNQKLFDAIFQKSDSLGKDGLLVIVIDEFGKHLEFAAKNNPEKEMYFIQQLAEFINSPDRNILLLTTLHQGANSYSNGLSIAQKNEWQKINGRIKEIVFNEPVEQLLSLATDHFTDRFGVREADTYSLKLLKAQKENHIFPIDNSFLESIGNKLFPLDIFSAYVLTKGLQKYGQNERSLFSFLNTSESINGFGDEQNSRLFSLPLVYDYLLGNFYNHLTTKLNSDYNNWAQIRNSIQRIEVLEVGNKTLAESIIKSVGLLSIFSSKAASINDSFLEVYFSNNYTKEDVNNVIKALERYKVILWSRFSQSFKLFDGTDIDINEALIKAENQIDEVVNIVPRLEAHFDFPVLTAKAHSYRTGTPRLFEYILSNKPVSKTPKDEIDGYINLVFNSALEPTDIEAFSAKEQEAIVYGFFTNTDRIEESIKEIDKTKKVLQDVVDDKVAKKELQLILRSNEKLLNHYVLDTMFNSGVRWYRNGSEVKISNNRQLNNELSFICNLVYHKAPEIRNELINRHKVSGAINGSRKNFFRALEADFEKKDLGFDENKFPPEKTIYYTLLNESGIHKETYDGYELGEPNKDSKLIEIWNVCNEFLDSAKSEQKPISDLIGRLKETPFKMKQGVIDFWVPTFLFIRRGDYALYSEGNFKPYINEPELHLIIKNPNLYKVRAFELNNLRLTFFNKYRELLKQKDSETLNVTSFIESIRPILLTFKNLTPYSQKTLMLSKSALNLRNAIQNAKEPDNVFFEEFPKALGYSAEELLKSDTNFDSYINDFQNCLVEIQNSYNALMNRIEAFINSEIIGKTLDFNGYQKQLLKRFESLKEHQLHARQKVFLQRLNSPLNDRDSWIASICQSLIGKTLSTIDDKDEIILKENMLHMIKELDNLSDLSKVAYDDQKENILKLDITTQKDGLQPHFIRISKDKMLKAKKSIDSIKKELGTNKQVRIAILAQLLKDELDNDKN